MDSTEKKVTVVGGGLAGAEAALQLAAAGISVDLYEMRPLRMTPAHHTGQLAELVCSNSLGSFETDSAPALLKEELRLLGSRLLEIALSCRVPAGHALAVDRQAFAEAVTAAVSSHPKIEMRRQEFPALPSRGVVIVASGPLTSEALAASIASVTGQAQLNFFDAASPILTRESIDHTRVFAASRYGKGEGEYLNCPMSKQEYERFWQELVAAERVPLKDFEKDTPYFQACMPVEVMAARGLDTLRFGPMKPVGLVDPRTGKRPYAVVQLRQDNAAADLFNIVGFQTNLKWAEQQRVLRMIPGLERAEFVRLGVMHRNTYLNSPLVLKPTLELKAREGIFFAGQLTGTEGYSEAIATGLVAARNAARLVNGLAPVVLPETTMIGALLKYVTSADPDNFQPINANWGLITVPVEWRALEKQERRSRLARRALASIGSAFPDKEPAYR